MIKKLLAIYQKLSKRERLILYASSVALLILFVDRLVLGPAVGKMAALETKIRDEEAAVRMSLHVLVQKARIQTESKEFMSYSVEAKDPEQEMTGLLKEIESMADSASVSLIYVKPANTSEASGTRKYLASLECESQMEQVAAFFHSIESSPKLLRIEKFDIQPKSKESSIARCSMTISKTVLKT
jgi:Tfp pilus assembly protein PilO